MSELTDLLIKELREHQKKRPDKPHDVDPVWAHQQYEGWQRVDDSLRLVLGVHLVENVLKKEKHDDSCTLD